MSRTRRSKAAGVVGASGALVAALLVVVASPAAVSALPGGCTSTWDGSVSSDWSTAGNWSPAGVPSGPAAIACIPESETVNLSSVVNVAAVHIDDFSDLNIGPGEALFASGPTVSSWSAQSQVFVDGGTLGGTGRVEVHGFLDFTGGSVLSSINAVGGASYGGQIGVLDVATDGEVAIDDQGLFLRTRYRIENDGLMSVNGDGTFIAADYGTSLLNESTATLQFNGDGGWYRGFPVAGQPLSQIVNRGLIDKAGGDPTVVDAWYVQEGAGHVQVNCCAVLAMPDDLNITAEVQADQALGTGKCAAQAAGTCVPSVNPAIDPMSVSLQIPNANPNPAIVSLQELTQPPDTTDSRAIGNDVFAHADGLVADPAQPATITLRFSQADVMSTPLAEVQVGHISDTGVMTKTPDCVSNALPAGAPYCIVRPVSRTAENTFVTVLTTQTSRWRLRRTGPTENFDQSAPGAPSGFSVAKAAPFDGSQVGLTWQPPANDGGAAVSAYRIYRDGVLVATTGSASAVVRDSGPGKHVFAIAAVNAIGQSGGVTAEITLAQLSKPRKLATLRGKKGGKKTAGVKWKPPASAGGLTLTGYQVKVLTAGGRKVKVAKVSASKLRYVLKLKPGRYVFKVRARNAGGNGPWSKATDPVRPR
jgi:hypothetical protein